MLNVALSSESSASSTTDGHKPARRQKRDVSWAEDVRNICNAKICVRGRVASGVIKLNLI